MEEDKKQKPEQDEPQTAEVKSGSKRRVKSHVKAGPTFACYVEKGQ